MTCKSSGPQLWSRTVSFPNPNQEGEKEWKPIDQMPSLPSAIPPARPTLLISACTSRSLRLYRCTSPFSWWLWFWRLLMRWRISRLMGPRIREGRQREKEQVFEPLSPSQLSTECSASLLLICYSDNLSFRRPRQHTWCSLLYLFPQQLPCKVDWTQSLPESFWGWGRPRSCFCLLVQHLNHYTEPALKPQISKVKQKNNLF